MSEARYAVGIDLGTTHCVMAAVDLTASDQDGWWNGSKPIPQLTAPGSVEERPMLPSFLYLPHPDELRPEDRTCRGANRSRSWSANWRGTWAAALRSGWWPAPKAGCVIPAWIGARRFCRPKRRRSGTGVAVASVDPLSGASAGRLGSQHPDAPLPEQDVVLTVPASFDPGGARTDRRSGGGGRFGPSGVAGRAAGGVVSLDSGGAGRLA
jgi:hypothetical protein